MPFFVPFDASYAPHNAQITDNSLNNQNNPNNTGNRINSENNENNESWKVRKNSKVRMTNPAARLTGAAGVTIERDYKNDLFRLYLNGRLVAELTPEQVRQRLEKANDRT